MCKKWGVNGCCHLISESQHIPRISVSRGFLDVFSSFMGEYPPMKSWSNKCVIKHQNLVQWRPPKTTVCSDLMSFSSPNVSIWGCAIISSWTFRESNSQRIPWNQQTFGLKNLIRSTVATPLPFQDPRHTRLRHATWWTWQKFICHW